MNINNYDIRYCKCGNRLTPHKAWFRNLIIYTCPKSNIFNKKNHSISRAFYVKVKPSKIKMVINKIK